MKYIITVIMALLLTGCATKYDTKDLSAGDKTLIQGKSVVIATSKNGKYGEITYPESGRMTAEAVRNAFALYTDDIEINTACHDFACLIEKTSANYIAIPEILHWEDRRTEWSGLSDQVTVKLTIYDSQTKDKLASTVISGTSKWMTFGGDHPQDMLGQPIKTFISSKY